MVDFYTGLPHILEEINVVNIHFSYKLIQVTPAIIATCSTTSGSIINLVVSHITSAIYMYTAYPRFQDNWGGKRFSHSLGLFLLFLLLLIILLLIFELLLEVLLLTALLPSPVFVNILTCSYI